MCEVSLDKQICNCTKQRSYDYLKRGVDLLLAITGLLVAIPIICICAVAIKVDSPGPVFFCQERLGRKNKPFAMYKLRTMCMDCELNGPQWAEKNDMRATRAGRLLRKYHLDELPQLWNVIKGEMSLVGPRPEREVFVQRFSSELEGFKNRTLVLPGLTGWAQVNGGYDLKPSDKLDLDLYYIRNRSIGFDLMILVRTLITVITTQGAR